MKVKVKVFRVNFDKNSINAVVKVSKFFPIKEDGFDKIIEYLKKNWLGLEEIKLIRNDAFKDIVELYIKMKKMSDEELKERNDVVLPLPFQIDVVTSIKGIERLFKNNL